MLHGQKQHEEEQEVTGIRPVGWEIREKTKRKKRENKKERQQVSLLLSLGFGGVWHINYPYRSWRIADLALAHSSDTRFVRYKKGRKHRTEGRGPMMLKKPLWSIAATYIPAHFDSLRGDTVTRQTTINIT